MAVTDPDAGAPGISAFVVEKADEGVSASARRRSKLGIKGSPDPRGHTSTTCGSPADRMIGEEGTGFATALAHPRPHPRSPSPPRRSASPRARSTTPSATSRSASSSARPIADFQGVQFMLADMAMKLEAARQLTYAAAAKSERAMRRARPT